jgi:hypothetical protein
LIHESLYRNGDEEERATHSAGDVIFVKEEPLWWK